MFQCVSESVTVIYPAGRGKGEPELVDVAGVRRRYGIAPEQVPDFIALRGDPSDGIPGAKGIGEKTAAELLQEHGDLERAARAAHRRCARACASRSRTAPTICAPSGTSRRSSRSTSSARRTPRSTTSRRAKAAQKRGMGRLAARLEAWGGA